MKQHILDIEPENLKAILCGKGMEPYRVRQLIEWIYAKRCVSFSSFTSLSKNVRTDLEKSFTLRSFTIKDKVTSKLDGTVRYVFSTFDGQELYTVYLPEKARNSVCISTQIGCPVGCNFCASGRTKFVRNLTAGEIIEQILQVENGSGETINNVLLMGMGEPLLNYDNVTAALRAMTDPLRLGMSRRRITVSTAGFVPQIEKLSQESSCVRLALSLHAPDDETRRKFISEKKVPYSVSEIIRAGLEYGRNANSRVTIEYIMAAGVNDSLLSAKKLVKLLQSCMQAGDDIRINLIPCNATFIGRWQPPAREELSVFQDYIAANNITATIRRPRGADIGAACGQLGF